MSRIRISINVCPVSPSSVYQSSLDAEINDAVLSSPRAQFLVLKYYYKTSQTRSFQGNTSLIQVRKFSCHKPGTPCHVKLQASYQHQNQFKRIQELAEIPPCQRWGDLNFLHIGNAMVETCQICISVLSYTVNSRRRDNGRKIILDLKNC